MIGKKKHIMILITMLVIILLFFLYYDFLLIKTMGIKYISRNNDYVLSHSTISNSYTINLDLNNLEANKNKVIYDDTISKIYIKEIQKIPGVDNYRVFFVTEGTYSVDGATLVSGLKHLKKNSNEYKVVMNAEINILYNKIKYNSTVSGISPLGYAGGDYFEFYLFPVDAKIDLIYNEKAVLSVNNLTVNTWLK